MENNQGRSPILIINQLALIGTRKNYIVPFHPGLNIIHGDSDTGKSSILNLIDYCLGANSVDLYAEITSSGRYCLLEVVLNGKTYTVKRNIFDHKAIVEVYQSDIAGMDDVFPLEYGPNYAKEGEAGFISDFFMDALSIPKVEIKQSPTKADSKMQRLSFRDIFKFNYLNQDDVGSKDLLDRKNPVVMVKNQETFKFLHNLLDEAISQLQAYISERTSQKNSLNTRYTTISAFLRETQLKPEEELESQKRDLRDKVAIINAELELLNHNMTINTSMHNELRAVIGDLDKNITNKNREKDNLQLQNRQNILLKNDYSQDIDKLETSLKMSGKLSQSATSHINCPLCNNDLKIEEIKSVFQESDTDFIDHEIKSLRRRFKDVANLIDENRNSIMVLQEEILHLSDQLDEARVLLDNRTKETISPFLSQRDGYLTSKTKMLEAIENIDQTLKIRNQLNQIASNVAKLEIEIEKLNSSLNELKAQTPTPEEVTSGIADLLSDFLLTVKMNNVTSVSIDSRTFMPSVRDMEYFRLTSGGVRTLVSVGYFVSILKNGMQKVTNHPNFLMIDTLGKYLGKTKSQYLSETSQAEDIKEGIRADDPTKYINMYKYLLTMCGNREDVQIIIVDNDIPPVIESDLKSSIVKEFNVKGVNGLPRGFIDDVHLQ